MPARPGVSSSACAQAQILFIWTLRGKSLASSLRDGRKQHTSATEKIKINMRSQWKGPFVDRNLLKSMKKINAKIEERYSGDLAEQILHPSREETLIGTEGRTLKGLGDTEGTIGRSLKIPTKIWSRRSVILPQFVGLTFQVHNGNRFLPVRITKEMIGFRFGEFAPTRKPTIHKEAKTKR